MDDKIEIVTERLRLRPLRPADAPALVTLLNDYEVSRWLMVVPYPYGRADALDFITHLEDADPLEALGIEAGGALVGVVGIGNSLGYWLGRAHHGKGYMTEAARALVDWAFTHRDGDRLTSGYFEGNAASANVLTKLGFVPDGEERVKSRAQGADVMLKNVVLTRAAWEARHE